MSTRLRYRNMNGKLQSNNELTHQGQVFVELDLLNKSYSIKHSETNIELLKGIGVNLHDLKKKAKAEMIKLGAVFNKEMRIKL